jgi:hypothetical protein
MLKNFTARENHLDHLSFQKEPELLLIRSESRQNTAIFLRNPKRMTWSQDPSFPLLKITRVMRIHIYGEEKGKHISNVLVQKAEGAFD